MTNTRSIKVVDGVPDLTPEQVAKCILLGISIEWRTYGGADGLYYLVRVHRNGLVGYMLDDKNLMLRYSTIQSAIDDAAEVLSRDTSPKVILLKE